MEEKSWFKVKKYGYGVFPYSQEGWMLTVGFMLVITLLAYNIERLTFGVTVILALFITWIFLETAKKKSDRDWHYRWKDKRVFKDK